MSSPLSPSSESLMSLSVSLTQLTSSFEHCDSFPAMQTLNLEIRERMETMKRLVEEADDEDHEWMREQLEGCQRRFRAANLNCLKRLKQKERLELLQPASNEVRGPRSSQLTSSPSSALKTSNDLNASFRHLSQRLSSVVANSKMTMDELVVSSQLVSETEEELRGMAAVIGQSKRLINKFASREVTDRVLIALGFAFFMACVLYIIRKRVMDPIDLLFLFFLSVANTLTWAFEMAMEVGNVAVSLWDDYFNRLDNGANHGQWAKEEM